MAANTGPDLNTYSIPEVALGDTFNTWRDVTNTGVYKLNKLKVYDGVSSSSIDITVAAGGTFAAVIADNVNKGVTFLQPVVFQSGVTFNGDVTFNASSFTVNANIVTIDDYALVLGDTAAGSTDTKINAAGGGGLLINRGTSGNTAEWLWKTTQVHGLTGVWQANAHIGISGATFGIYPNQGGVLPVHGSGIRLDGGSTSDHGLLVELTSSGDAGTTSNRSIQFERYSPAGATVFMEVLSGTTYGARPFVNISDGVNRKTVKQSGNTFVFGNVLRFDGTNYQLAQASSAETAEVVGIVSKIITANNEFEITFLGEIFGNFASVNATGLDLVAGTTYYLTPGDAGKITPVQPTSPGTVHKAVLIATGTKSALVIPFTGGVLQSPIQIANSSSVATRINQINALKVGDMVRFKAYSGTGVTLSYNDGANTVEQYWTDGIYVKAQANTVEEAEVAGMVIAVGASGNINSNFDVLMDGFFNVSSWSTPYTNRDAGTVYFLNTGCAGTTGCFEKAVSSHTTTPPSAEGTVRKPLFMATSALSGYLFSYRGDVRGAATGVSYANLDNFLVSNISDGISGDLKIGVYNASTTGLECIKLAAGQGGYATSVGVTGYVGVGGGWLAMNSAYNGNRILSQLDVRGDLRVGTTLASASTPQGRDLIISRFTDDVVSGGVTANTFNVIGTQYGSSSLVLGHGVRPGRASNSWISSVSNTVTTSRSVLVAGVSGSDPALVWKTASSSATALGGAVTLTDRFSIVGNTASFSGLFVGIGTTEPKSALHVQNGNVRIGIYGNIVQDIDFRSLSGSGGWARGIVYDDGVTPGIAGSSAPGTTAGMGLLGGYGGGVTTVTRMFMAFGDQPWADGLGLFITPNGYVGCGVTGPTVALDVNGAIKNKNPRFFVGTKASDIVATRQTSYTTLTFGTVSINDTYNGVNVYNATNGVFTAPITGRYVFFGQILFAHAAGSWNSTTTGGGAWYFAKNYGTASASSIGPSNPTPNETTVGLVHILVSSTAIADLTAGDTVRIAYFGKPFNENHNSFGGYLIG